MSSNINLTNGSGEIGEAISSHLKNSGMEVGLKCCVLTGLKNITMIAIITIGSLAVAGVLSPVAAGFTAVGLGAAYMALELGHGNFSARKYYIIPAALFSAAVITVGALGGAGILSASQVGWGVLGSWMSSIPVGCFFACKQGMHSINLLLNPQSQSQQEA